MADFRLGKSLSAARSSKKVGRAEASPPSVTKLMPSALVQA